MTKDTFTRNTAWAVGLAILLLIVLGMASQVRAECNDPSKLTPETKKAHDELVEACKELGCTVSIRCWEKVEVEK